MKKVYFLLLGLFLFSGVNAQIINLPFEFRDRLLSGDGSKPPVCRDINNNWISIDTNYDGQISVSEALLVYKLDIDSGFMYGYSYNDKVPVVTGIENFTNLIELKCGNNGISTLNISGLNNLQVLDVNNNNISTINLTGFNNLQVLNVSNNNFATINLTGFTNLQVLDVSGNQLNNLDLTGLNNLNKLYCNNNNLTNLDLIGKINLSELYCYSNQLTTLDLTGLINLSDLFCHTNQLTTLNLTGLNNLFRIICSYNQISTLDLTGKINLSILECQTNQLTALNLTGLNNISRLYFDSNQLSTIDLSELNMLAEFNCSNSPLLSSIIGKNNSSYGYSLNFQNCLNLKYICVADSKIALFQSKISSYGYTNCELNTYCSFVPGGTYYTIQGNNRYDSNNNGCDASDIPASNFKFSITNGTNSGNLISNTMGTYSIPVIAGTHTITPTLENPTYFNVSPNTLTVTFPTQASPFTQDFCITANGVHPDLEVTLLPIVRARPGFDATYKIIYKNKGNTTQSGSVNLNFDDAVLDFVSANPVTTNQTVNNLSWDFTNLLPFETREITLTLNVNSPMETPAVNSGDILNYTTTITSPAIDDTPNDNTIALHQTVVNSLDPNDKTCLEGTTISPAMVGEYVHYVIRFENTGTFPAENIVVKDMIDLAKFDINSLVPIKGSHDFVTNIISGNKVEFIFENINLPFDDANNDGFVAFKIKTKSTLVLGDTFTNSANIYFDYNFPIVTNTYTTTVQTLGKQDFDFAKYFTVYPNPASSTLNLSVKSGIVVNSITIYNTLGQLVIAIPNAQSVSNIDVSNLKTGNYFIKMNTDKGTSNTKFIKN